METCNGYSTAHKAFSAVESVLKPYVGLCRRGLGSWAEKMRDMIFINPDNKAPVDELLSYCFNLREFSLIITMFAV